MNTQPTPSKKEQVITDELKEQILKVRDTGRTNMLLFTSVQKIAYELELFDLVVFLDQKENRKAYVEFIINGKR